MCCLMQEVTGPGMDIMEEEEEEEEEKPAAKALDHYSIGSSHPISCVGFETSGAKGAAFVGKGPGTHGSIEAVSHDSS